MFGYIFIFHFYPLIQWPHLILGLIEETFVTFKVLSRADRAEGNGSLRFMRFPAEMRNVSLLENYIRVNNSLRIPVGSIILTDVGESGIFMYIIGTNTKYV